MCYIFHEMSDFTTILRLLFTKIFQQINKSFYFHIIVNLLINTITIPLLDQQSTANIINGNFDFGINMFIIITATQCISNLHNSYFLEQSKIDFNSVSHKITELYTLEKIEQISHACQKKLLDGDYQSKKSAVKWGFINLSTQLMTSFIQIIPIMGFIIWIGYRSPFTIITYILSIYCCMKYSSIESVSWEEYNNGWDKYYNFRNNQYSDLVHGRGQTCHTNMADCMYTYEKTKGKYNLGELRYTNNINIVFNIVTIINCYFVLYGNNNITFIIMYLQYVRYLKDNLQLITNMLKQYKQVETDYLNYVKLFEDTIPFRPPNKYVDVDTNIVIEKGSTFTRDKYTLCVKDTLTFPKGVIVYVSGGSGSGKTTLFDIMAGIIKHSQTQFKVLIDGLVMEDGIKQNKP